MADTHAERFDALRSTLARLREQRAVLVSQEERKAAERATLEAELRDAGVNLDDLDGEFTRLTREADEILQASTEAVGLFKQELKAVTTTIEA